MNIPGFTGEASLSPTIGIYRGNALSDGRHDLGQLVPMQIGFPWTPLPPTYSPIGGWPVTPPPPPHQDGHTHQDGHLLIPDGLHLLVGLRRQYQY